MKTRIILFIVTAVATALISCKPEPSLSFSSDTLSIDSKGGTFDIDVKANYAWIASSDDKWIAFNSASGGESGSLIVRISSNKLTDPRTGTIKVVCEGLTKTIRVEQAQKNTLVPKDGDQVQLSWEEQRFELNVDSNVDYEVSTEETGWINVVRTKGMSASTVLVSVMENSGTSSRDADIRFVCNGELLRTVTVTQEGHPQSVRIFHTLQTISAPVLFGFGMSGTIYWGDGASAPYISNLSHSYGSDGLHEILIESNGAATVSLSSISGIEKVDLSLF